MSVPTFSLDDLRRAVDYTRSLHAQPRFVVATRDEQYAMRSQFLTVSPGEAWAGSLGSIIGLNILNSWEALITPGALAERLPEEIRRNILNHPEWGRR
jgi:hypothetical protein